MGRLPHPVDGVGIATEDGCAAELNGFLGLGSNMGDRRELLQAAVDRLARPGIRVLRCSSVYETDPVGNVLDQRAFLNAAIGISTCLDPRALLAEAKRVELALGRDPAGPRHGPRPVDIDLLLLRSAVLDSEELAVPHRDLLDRRFVLVPLLELDFALAHPDGRRLSDALARLPIDEQRVTWLGPPLDLP